MKASLLRRKWIRHTDGEYVLLQDLNVLSQRLLFASRCFQDATLTFLIGGDFENTLLQRILRVQKIGGEFVHTVLQGLLRVQYVCRSFVLGTLVSYCLTDEVETDDIGTDLLYMVVCWPHSHHDLSILQSLLKPVSFGVEQWEEDWHWDVSAA